MLRCATLLAQDKDGVLVTDKRGRTTVTALSIEIYDFKRESITLKGA